MKFTAILLFFNFLCFPLFLFCPGFHFHFIIPNRLRQSFKSIYIQLYCLYYGFIDAAFSIFIFLFNIFYHKVIWLLRHHVNPPLVKGKNKMAEELVDRQLPELIFHMEELRSLIKKYSQVCLIHVWY